jgi:hypothetical protein
LHRFAAFTDAEAKNRPAPANPKSALIADSPHRIPAEY